MGEATALRRLHEAAGTEARDAGLEELRQATLSKLEQINRLQGQLLQQTGAIDASVLGVAGIQAAGSLLLPGLLLVMFALGHLLGVLLAAGSLGLVQRWLDALGRHRGLALGRSACGVLPLVMTGVLVNGALSGTGARSWPVTKPQIHRESKTLHYHSVAFIAPVLFLCLSSTSLAEAPPGTSATQSTKQGVAKSPGGEPGQIPETDAIRVSPATTPIPGTPGSSGRPNLADEISPRKVPLGLCDGS